MPRVDSISPGLINPLAPTFVAAGTAATGTGAVTPTIPTNVANDIILVFAQSANQSISMTTGGYTQIGPQPGNGTAAAAASNRLAIFWKRSAGAEGNPTVADSGDHTIANCIVIRGCITIGDPFQFLSSGRKTTASTTLTATGGITGIDNMLVIVFAAQSVDSASAQFSGWTNSSLASITEGSDDSTTDGQGGGIASAYGVKTVAGSVTSTTATEANSTVDAFSTIAMIPANVIALNSSPSPVWVFQYTNPVGTDAYVVPTNATYIDIITIGAGGAGGSGIASTAAGGGGGGGGAWARRAFRPSELTSPLQITVGIGGVGGATKSTAGSSQVKDNNGSGNTLCNTTPGVIGSDATSNSGGGGGAGGQVGSIGTAATASGGLGGTGGAGGTTGAVGTKADMGGAGGGGGKNAAGSGTGGASMFGGGSGGGGGSATNGGVGGVGGGGQAGGSNTGGSATATISTLGGSGGGGSGTGTGGNGAFPGGGGGGGGPVANSGGNGADGVVIITTYF